MIDLTGVAHVETEVEKESGKMIYRIGNALGQTVARSGNEELQVDVATRIENTTAVAAAGDEGKGMFLPGFFYRRKSRRESVEIRLRAAHPSELNGSARR